VAEEVHINNKQATKAMERMRIGTKMLFSFLGSVSQADVDLLAYATIQLHAGYARRISPRAGGNPREAPIKSMI